MLPTSPFKWGPSVVYFRKRNDTKAKLNSTLCIVQFIKCVCAPTEPEWCIDAIQWSTSLLIVTIMSIKWQKKRSRKGEDVDSRESPTNIYQWAAIMAYKKKKKRPRPRAASGVVWTDIRERNSEDERAAEYPVQSFQIFDVLHMENIVHNEFDTWIVRRFGSPLGVFVHTIGWPN
jgi:hypothetical protein